MRRNSAQEISLLEVIIVPIIVVVAAAALTAAAAVAAITASAFASASRSARLSYHRVEGVAPAALAYPCASAVATSCGDCGLNMIEYSGLLFVVTCSVASGSPRDLPTSYTYRFPSAPPTAKTVGRLGDQHAAKSDDVDGSSVSTGRCCRTL